MASLTHAVDAAIQTASDEDTNYRRFARVAAQVHDHYLPALIYLP